MYNNLLFQNIAFTNTLNFNIQKDYEAIVLGKIISKEVKKSNNYWITEYKLKTKKWFYKKSSTEKSKYLIIKILGAELPERGIVIKSSVSPNYIPVNQDAVFLLEENIKKQKNVYSLSTDGVIYGDELQKFKSMKSIELIDGKLIPVLKEKHKFSLKNLFANK